MITGIDHINITVTDLEQSVKFFTELLDFRITNQGNLEGEWMDKVVGLKGVKAKYVQLSLGNSETNIELIQYFSPSGAKSQNISLANSIGFRHMALSVSNIEEKLDRLKKAGIEVFSEIQIYNKRKKLFYFTGPDGVLLELAEYGEFL